jgi:hypothetical protein
VGPRIRWAPIRGGIAADGQHGLTFGYMTLERPDSAPLPLKYLAYWINRPEGWRIAAYNVRRRLAGDVSTAMMAPALPVAAVAPTTDPSTLEAHRESVIAAERAFSDRAQIVGLGPAFVENGSADAVNMGPRSGPFLVGAETIGRMVGEGEPAEGSSVSWGPDEAVIVASSGDLGITFGRIRSNDPASDSPPFPFFTIWRRASPDAPWRYVAE